MLKDICKVFFFFVVVVVFGTNWGRPGWTNEPKCFNSIPKKYQMALKVDLHFPKKKGEKDMIDDFVGNNEYFRQSEDSKSAHFSHK